MSSRALTQRFLDILNFVVEDRGYRFGPDSAVCTILIPDVIDPGTFVGCLADAKGCELAEVDQTLIMPETDTVEEMCARLAIV